MTLPSVAITWRIDFLPCSADLMQTFIREDFKQREPQLDETNREILKGHIKVSNLWLRRFYYRCTALNKILGKHRKTIVNGDSFKVNFEAAVKAVPPMLTWDDDCNLHIRREVFVSQIDFNEVTDPDAVENEAEDLAPESAEAVGGAGEGSYGDIEKATHTDELPPLDVEDEMSDKALDNSQADQQSDMDDAVTVEEEFENEQADDENLGNENDEDQDEEVDLEIHDERRRGGQQRLLEITITLEY